VLSEYGIDHPEITFLRHNENRTYKVTDKSDRNTYLFRLHWPITENFLGLQHTEEGLHYELQLLQEIANNTDLTVQYPIQNRNGDFVKKIPNGNSEILCSVVKWIGGRNLQKEDLSDPQSVYRLGVHTAKLHQFLRTINHVPLNARPHYGHLWIRRLSDQISLGIGKGLFSQSNFSLVDQVLNIMQSRLADLDDSGAWGLIHADLNMGNILVTAEEGYAFIDFSLFGYGYYLFDVAMGALNSTVDTRDRFFEGYFGDSEVAEDILTTVEGFMLLSVLGYYAFHMENEQIHPWIKERMPLFCKKNCQPFIDGERIFHKM
jgi:Ser/Thr protein kinase RdoA (MazF antagonist)